MKEKIHQYIVSSAGWQIKVDHTSPEQAVKSGLLMAFEKYKKDLYVSTVIMVNEELYHNQDCVSNAFFFNTAETMEKIGLKKLSLQLKQFIKLCN